MAKNYVRIEGGHLGVTAALRRAFSLDPSPDERIERLIELLDEVTLPPPEVGRPQAPRGRISSTKAEVRFVSSREPSEEPLSTLVPRLLQRLDELERRLNETPTRDPRIGHNRPPSDIGLPPYTDEDSRQAHIAIQTVRVELSRDDPAPETLHQAESALRKISTAVLKWLAKKLDLAVDELIKKGITVAVAGGTFWLMLQTADDIADVARQLASAAL